MTATSLLARARRAAPEAAAGRAVLAISAAALATAVLAACSATSAPGTSPAPPASSPASPASSAAADPATSGPVASAGPLKSGADLCSILTSAQVSSITGESVEAAVPMQIEADYSCTYALSNSAIQVQVAPGGSMIGYADFSRLVSSRARPAGSAISVPGLGDQSVASSAGVGVKTPGYAILVAGIGQMTGHLGIEVKVARVLVARLG